MLKLLSDFVEVIFYFLKRWKSGIGINKHGIIKKAVEEFNLQFNDEQCILKDIVFLTIKDVENWIYLLFQYCFYFVEFKTLSNDINLGDIKIIFNILGRFTNLWGLWYGSIFTMHMFRCSFTKCLVHFTSLFLDNTQDN